MKVCTRCHQEATDQDSILYSRTGVVRVHEKCLESDLYRLRLLQPWIVTPKTVSHVWLTTYNYKDSIAKVAS